MADVQTENGYTRIANEILEKIAAIKLSPTQYRLVFVIWRFTYGFKRKQHDMSLTFLSKATGCDKRQIQRELKGLEERKLIEQDIKTGSYRKISFNKNHDEWVGKTTIGETTIGEIDNGENINTTIGETVNDTIGEIDNQERKKENFKEINTPQVPLKEIELKETPSAKAGVLVKMLNEKFPERKRFGVKGNIAANDEFAKFLESGKSAERLLITIQGLEEELPPWDIVRLASEEIKTESQVEAERIRHLRDIYDLGEDYFEQFGDIGEYHDAVKELKEIGQL